LLPFCSELFFYTCEEHRLKVFENRVLRRTFGARREEVAGGLDKAA